MGFIKKEDNVITSNTFNAIGEIAQKTNEDQKNLINTILNKFIDDFTLLQEKQSKHVTLNDKYHTLNKYLHLTLNNTIEISLTNDLNSERDYILVDYELSYPDKYLILVLKRHDEINRLKLPLIEDINYNSCSGDRLKTWIYLDNSTWRFYLNYQDNSNINSSEFQTDKFILEHTPKEYEQYLSTDPQKYHIEKFKYNLKNTYKGQKIIFTKSGSEICLLNTLSDTSSYNSRNTGTIYFINRSGKFGQLEYDIINPNTFNNNKEKYIELLDISHNFHDEGIGTEALKYLDEISSNENISTIIGTLSQHDLITHRDKLLNFYKKNNFKITENSLKKTILK